MKSMFGSGSHDEVILTKRHFGESIYSNVVYFSACFFTWQLLVCILLYVMCLLCACFVHHHPRIIMYQSGGRTVYFAYIIVL